MNKLKYPHLFEPLKLGNTTLRNRIIAAPTGYLHLDAESLPTQAAIAYFERKAKGGAAMITIGEGYVDTRHGMDIPKCIHLDEDKCLSGIYMLADAITKYGAVASMELQHAGMYASESYRLGNPIYAPTRRLGSGSKAGARLDGVLIPEMPEELIWETIEKYAEAAKRVKQAGFGACLLHAGHGWLLYQMMSPKINTRSDKWGGSLENRMRMPIAICKRIKEVCGPDFLIDFRFSAADVKNPDGYTPEDGVEMAKMIDGYVDLIHCSVGNHEIDESFVVVHPSMFLEEGANLRYAAEIKKQVKTPVVTVGAFTDPALMEQVLAEGKADAVAIARGLICDPDLPNKARAGRDEDINRCLQCLYCFSNLVAVKHFACALNPIIGRELEDKFDSRTATPKKVMVAGGGIGGMEAALTASSRGHQVVLCEKTGRLGGVLLCEKDVSFKKKVELYLRNQSRRVMEDPNITVLLNTKATPELAASLEPDAIIAALGARPVVPTYLPGYDLPHVYCAEDIYYDLNKAGKNVVICGAGLVGCELGIHLFENGRKVTILQRSAQPRFGDNFLHGQAIKARLQETDVQILERTKAVGFTEDGVLVEGPDGEYKIPCDTAVYAVGERSLSEETNALRPCAPEFYAVGDCNNRPETIAKAVKEAYYAAWNIGTF